MRDGIIEARVHPLKIETMEQLVNRLGDKEYSLGQKFSGSNMKMHIFPVNETGTNAAIEKILEGKEKSAGKEIAICYSGLLGIDMAMGANMQGILLLNKNPKQKLFWRAFLEMVKETEWPDLKEKFTELIYSDDIKFVNGKKAKDEYKSVLQDKELYEKFRKMVKAGMVAATDMDVLDVERHKELKKLFGKIFKAVIIYLSNIPMFYEKGQLKMDFFGDRVNPGDFEKLYGNQLALSGKDTKIVVAEYDRKAVVFRLKVEKAPELAARIGGRDCK